MSRLPYLITSAPSAVSLASPFYVLRRLPNQTLELSKVDIEYCTLIDTLPGTTLTSLYHAFLHTEPGTTTEQITLLYLLPFITQVG